FPPHFGHLPSGVRPAKSSLTGGSFGAPSLALVLRSRGWNSKPTLPPFTDRNASNLRPVFFETKPRNRSVLPSVNSLVNCAGSISCCKVIFGHEKSHVFCGPTAFSQVNFMPVSNTREPHFGHLPSGSLPEKSTGGAASPFSPCCSW